MNRRKFLQQMIEGLICLGVAPDVLLAKTSESVEVYLTIDDGPGDNMELILEKLGKKNKATFFVLGQLLHRPKGFYDAYRAAALGHAIGNHSYSHPHFSAISIDEAKEEIEKTGSLIQKVYTKVGRQPPLLFRFPYADPGYRVIVKDEKMIREGNPEKKKEIADFLKSSGYVICNWTIDSEDWKYYAGDKSLNDVIKELEKTRAGDIILVHESATTANHLIPFYTDSGKYLLKPVDAGKLRTKS